jgi:hypothetical protein
VFSRILTGSLRLLAVPPDALEKPPLTIMAQTEAGP